MTNFGRNLRFQLIFCCFHSFFDHFELFSSRFELFFSPIQACVFAMFGRFGLFDQHTVLGEFAAFWHQPSPPTFCLQNRVLGICVWFSQETTPNHRHSLIVRFRFNVSTQALLKFSVAPRRATSACRVG